jgi:hypothetical protein
MPRYACPVCGDPSAFPFWGDPEPPEGCPHDDAWLMDGKRPEIKNVSECAYQRKKAWQAAEFRKLVPDAFDATGTMLPGQIARVLTAFNAKHPNKPLVL